MTPLNVSSLSANATSTPPATIQLASGITRGPSLARMLRNSGILSAADSKRAPQVTSCAPRSPITRPKKPAITAAMSGRKTTPTAKTSALHNVDVLDRDRASIAEVDNQNRQTDRRFRRCYRQHEHRKRLADEVAQKDRKGDEIDRHRKQHQFDRHQHDDDVLAVEKDAENPECEEKRGNRQVMREADRHYRPPPPMGTLTTSTDWARVRASCAEIDCRLTSARWRRVNTIAPIIATSRISPAA